MKAHLSIHDVAPDTLPQVAGILDALGGRNGPRVMLLVIPGLDWQPAELSQLRIWVAEGHVLAGHGWVHRVEKRKSFKHKLHGVLLSRFVAEHLSLDEKGICDLMQKNYDWFVRNGLPAPEHYVPPAWALGNLPVLKLAELPFRSVETLSGVWFPQEKAFRKMALLGYEADTSLRALFLKMFNAWNRRRARKGELLRISLHPDDLTLKLAAEILLDCQRYDCHPELS
ncbi:polysaccharide deacetylase family protein [Kiritimatiellaeota bacterium B1221]|nr:polysaccharide deacetylase family protein [Kiritimatiellaeota bacterium B1221]